MKKIVTTSSVIVVLIATLVVSVYATSINAQVNVNQRLDIVLEFKDVADYSKIFENGELEVLDETTSPIKTKIEQQKLSGVVGWSPNPVVFDNETKSIKVAFYIAGFDIVNTQVNTEKASKLCKIRTDWRRVQLNFSGTIFDISNYFRSPVAQWLNFTDDEGRIHFVDTSPDLAESSFSFILPSSAKDVHFAADRETILFELPLSFEDELLNSPLLVLIVLIIIVCVVLVYRKIVR